MLGTTLRSIPIGILICLALESSASADELTDAISALQRATVGHWVGHLSGTDAGGERFEVDDAFTFVLTSDDGLDHAMWSADTLTIGTHEGGGIYRIRSWNGTGRPSEIESQMRIPRDPDASGNGEWVLELEQRASDGTVMDTREHFTLSGDSLRMAIEMRPANSEGPFETMVTGTWSRERNQ